MKIGPLTITLKRTAKGVRQFSLTIFPKGREGALLIMPPSGYHTKWIAWLSFGNYAKPSAYTKGSLYFGTRFLTFAINKPVEQIPRGQRGVAQ